MGKKIPGKKHHGVKDPAKQKKKREAPMKLKANARPKNLDDQEIPKKLMIISKLREDAKKPNLPKPKVPKSNLLDSTKHMGLEMKLPGMKKDLKPIPIFQQQEGEKERQFFRRVNQMTAQFLHKKEYEAKFNVDCVEDENTGKTKFVDRQKDELDDHVEKLKAKEFKKKTGIVKRSKEEKRKAKRLDEKEKRQKKKRRLYKQNEKQDEQDEFADFNDKDQVMFQDVVHAPPKLPGIRGKPALSEARRPGQQKDLLLLNNKNSAQFSLHTQSTVHRVNKEKDSKTGKKMKQRISLARQQMQENDRVSIVEQYRALKQQKQQKTQNGSF